MTRRLIALTALSLLVIACGDPETSGTTITPDPISGTIHVSGGLEGIDEIWTLASDGTVTGPNAQTGRISGADLATLRAAISAAGFFDLDAEYMPDDTCCDRFTYVLTLTVGDRTNTVTTIDAAEAPQTLFALIGTFRGALSAATQ
ncbi:MAG TPA: protealysin inhibitor emfourin [Acidimicrobiia bacterium]